jgi:FixJ family two-component response regulator
MNLSNPGLSVATEPERLSSLPAGTKRVYIIDDDQNFRLVMRRLIETFGYEVETFASASTFLVHARDATPSCAIVDYRMDGMSGIELQAELTSRGDNLPIIFLTGFADVEITVEAMRNGAVTLLQKPVRSDPLQNAIREAFKSAEKTATNRIDVRHANISAEHAQLVGQLSPREREVADLVATGYSNKRIARKLGLSEKTIEKHRSNCVRKLRVGSSAEMVRAIVVAEMLEL